MIQFILYKIGMQIALILPLKSGYELAELIAKLQYKFCVKDRASVISNLKIILGTVDEKILEPSAKAVFVNFAKYLLDFFRFSKIDSNYIAKFIKVQGRENLDEAFKKGKGVIALTAHVGNWEMAGIVTALFGYPVNAVALSHKDKRVNSLFTSQREMKGVKVISLGVALRRCFIALKNNELIGLLGDRDFTQGGVMVEFLGRQVRMPKGPAMFCIKSGPVVIPTFAVRLPDDTYKLIYEKPVDYTVTGNLEEDLKAITKKLIAPIEEMIKRYPQQWFMFREFWAPDANKI